MLVTPSGIVILVKFVHSSKASVPIVVTLEGISIEVIFVLLKAYSPIVVTLKGIVIFVKLVQSLKAFFSIYIILLYYAEKTNNITQEFYIFEFLRQILV